MRWPSQITVDSKLKVGSSYDSVVDVTDLLPTLIANGTFVNGKRVEEELLITHSSRLPLADISFEVIDPVAKPSETIMMSTGG